MAPWPFLRPDACLCGSLLPPHCALTRGMCFWALKYFNLWLLKFMPLGWREQPSLGSLLWLLKSSGLAAFFLFLLRTKIHGFLLAVPLAWVSTYLLHAFRGQLRFHLCRYLSIPIGTLKICWQAYGFYFSTESAGAGLLRAGGGGAMARTSRHAQGAAATLLGDVGFKRKSQLPIARQ